MVQKFAACLRGPYAATPSSDPVHAECRRALTRNAMLHHHLGACKDQISRYHASHAWDAAKRRTNEYELVGSAGSAGGGVAAHAPISRSFFKMWELLHDYWGCMRAGEPSSAPMVAAFLAEGPGGFVEAYARYRAERHGGPRDQLHAMTLLSRHRQVPQWKALQMQDALAPGSTLRVHAGADGTGDLCRVANVDALVAAVGRGACDLVTADGGFDFSAAFNAQEVASLPLVACEVLAALLLQRVGGALVLKVYDLHHMASLQLLHVVRGAYFGMRLVKPLTSRPANSEKYVVCTGFLGARPAVLDALRAACARAGESVGFAGALAAALRRVESVPPRFIIDVVHSTTVFVMRQVRSIGLALECAAAAEEDPDGGGGRGRDAEVRRQLELALRWCHRYGVRVAPVAVRALMMRAAAQGGGGGARVPALDAASSTGTT